MPTMRPRKAVCVGIFLLFVIFGIWFLMPTAVAGKSFQDFVSAYSWLLVLAGILICYCGFIPCSMPNSDDDYQGRIVEADVHINSSAVSVEGLSVSNASAPSSRLRAAEESITDDDYIPIVVVRSSSSCVDFEAWQQELRQLSEHEECREQARLEREAAESLGPNPSAAAAAEVTSSLHVQDFTASHPFHDGNVNRSSEEVEHVPVASVVGRRRHGRSRSRDRVRRVSPTSTSNRRGRSAGARSRRDAMESRDTSIIPLAEPARVIPILEVETNGGVL